MFLQKKKKKRFVRLSGTQIFNKSSGFAGREAPASLLMPGEGGKAVPSQLLVLPGCLVCSGAPFGWKSWGKMGDLGVIGKSRVVVTEQTKPSQGSPIHFTALRG